MKVICKDNHNGANFLTVGREYNVLREDAGWYVVINDEGWESYYAKYEFTVVADAAETKKHNKYSREIVPGIFVDVYQVLRAFNVTDPCLQHMLKKCLAAGVRGHKNKKEDLQDILASAKRALEMHEEWEDKKTS